MLGSGFKIKGAKAKVFCSRGKMFLVLISTAKMLIFKAQKIQRFESAMDSREGNQFILTANEKLNGDA